MPGSTEKKVLAALCATMRGEPFNWPAHSDSDFYKLLPPLAYAHGADVLACHLLKGTADWEKLPANAREALLLSLRQRGAIELVRKHDLLALLDAMHREGVPMLLLKGGALAYTHYPEPHLRPRVDTDVFIDPADILRVKNIFFRLGHELVGRTYKSHQFNSVRTELGGGTINYDVHWRSNNHAAYARVISFDEALRESVAIPGLEKARTLKPAHALLQACIHRAANPAHDPDRLIWLYDIHLLVSSMSVEELAVFADHAVNANLQAICHDALKNTRALFETPLPGSLLDMLAAPAPADHSFKERLSESQMGLIIDDLKDLPDFKSRIALVREYLFPPGQYLLDRYGREARLWLPFLYVRYLVTGFYERLVGSIWRAR